MKTVLRRFVLTAFVLALALLTACSGNDVPWLVQEAADKPLVKFVASLQNGQVVYVNYTVLTDEGQQMHCFYQPDSGLTTGTEANPSSRHVTPLTAGQLPRLVNDVVAWAKEQELPEGPEEGELRLGLTAWEMMFFEGVQTYSGWAYSLSDRTFTEVPSTTGRAGMAKYGILTVFYLNGAVHIFLNE